MAKLTKEGYINELRDIRNKLSDFLENIKAGNISYFKEIALKLRVLFIPKSSKKPLIKIVSDLLKIDIYVFIIPSLQDMMDEGLIPEFPLVFEQTNNAVLWFERDKPTVGIFEALEKKEVMLNDKRHSYRKIIEVVADKMAAHIDDKIKDEDLALHGAGFLIAGHSIAQRAIIDTGKASIELIDRILAFIESDQESPYIRKRS